jgi:hypothetical protein
MLDHQAKRLQYPLDRRVAGLQNQSGCGGEENLVSYHESIPNHFADLEIRGK